MTTELKNQKTIKCPKCGRRVKIIYNSNSRNMNYRYDYHRVIYFSSLECLLSGTIIDGEKTTRWFAHNDYPPLNPA